MAQTLLIGDIGSTKSTWWYQTDRVDTFQLQGYNPAIHTDGTGDALFQALRSLCGKDVVSTIWYYGAGVLDEHTAHDVQYLIDKYFPKSQSYVASDLTGAALASCGRSAGTVAILGTGSHAAVFDGHRIIRQAVSLGYIMGDEGGGCDIGKSLLQGFYYKEMPDDLRMSIVSLLPQDRSELLQRLRMSETPNQYLAGFARIAADHIAHPWIVDMVRSRFDLFVWRHVMPLAPEGPVHVVGSIGCIFEGLFRDVLAKAGLEAGLFLTDPAERLFEMHIEDDREKK